MFGDGIPDGVQHDRSPSVVTTRGRQDKLGKRALVTGGAEGIGRAYAVRLAEDGADVVIVDRLDASETVSAIAALGRTASYVVCDLTDIAAVDRANRQIINEIGGCDILVNNAGSGAPTPLDELDFSVVRQVLALNLEAPFLMCKAHVNTMKARGWGRIINIATSIFTVPAPNWAHYMMAKGGVIGLTRALATDLGRFGITVNAISPGLVRTPLTMGGRGGHAAMSEEGFEMVRQMQPIPQTLTPNDLVGTLSFLASDDASLLTGQVITVDGGVART